MEAPSFRIERKFCADVVTYLTDIVLALSLIGVGMTKSFSGFASGDVLSLFCWRCWLVAMRKALVQRCGARTRPCSQQTAPVTQRPTSTPYTGDLSIFEYPDRDKKLQIDRVMDLLGITAGKNVADIGAGSGWFTVRAARRVGPTGAVIAEDINPLAIEYIGKRVSEGRSVECADGAGCRRMIRGCLREAWMRC